MAWNEPGGGKRDPWSGKGGDQGPPDLDEVVKKLQDRMGGLFGGRRGGGPGGEGGGGGGLAGIGLIILLVAVVVAGYKSFYIIGPAERGVIKRFGAYIETTEPGPHFLIPFIDHVDVVNVDEINKFAHRAQMLTKDENIVDVTLTVQYRIQDPADYLFQDADPKKTIVGAMESSLREVIGKSKLDDIITENRSAIATEVEKGTQELLDLYRTGLLLTNVNFQDASPPQAVKAAFDDAIKAREDRERLQNQAQTYANDVVPRARGAAARQIEDAKAHKAKVVAEAEGETARFLALLTEYEKAPNVTRERLYLDTMQDVLKQTGKVMMDTKGGNNLTYIPLDRLMSNMPAIQPQPELPRYSEPEPTKGNSDDSRARDSRSRRIR
jgi:membrane protease subunit HflK